MNNNSRALNQMTTNSLQDYTISPEAYQLDPNINAVGIEGRYWADSDVSEKCLAKLVISDTDLKRSNFNFADLFDMLFDNCEMRATSFRVAALKRLTFESVNLTNADFSNSNLEDVVFSNSNLTGANWVNATCDFDELKDCQLGKADFSQTFFKGLSSAVLETALAARGTDLLSRVQQAASESRALDMNTWHTCATQHCIAGWAIHLTGVAGYALESYVGSAMAGAILLPEANHLFYEVYSSEDSLEALLALR